MVPLQLDIVWAHKEWNMEGGAAVMEPGALGGN